MRRTVCLVPLAAVCLMLGLSACASAPERVGPWCAVADKGWGNVVEDCSYATIEDCRRVILSGNRGTCNRNPRWAVEHKRRR
jgi:hypothetical protein